MSTPGDHHTSKTAIKGQKLSIPDISDGSAAAKTVSVIILKAIIAGANNIHIEPLQHSLNVRYRIDGLMRSVNKLPKTVQDRLVSRIKMLAKLKIDEHNLPQEGQFKIQDHGNTYAIRAATLPVTDGEKILLSITNESGKAPTLEQLGYWGKNLESLNQSIKQTRGLILFCGPTGSGKSTSLFGVINILNQPGVKISTIEDPIEYKIPRVNQSQVNQKTGLTFTAGLKALLSNKPDIVLVGDIDNYKTANESTKAALDGRLVFGAVSADNSTSCLALILNMGVEPFMIASTLRAIVAQRLVRKLCQNCRKSIKPKVAELKQINDAFGTDDTRYHKQIHTLTEAYCSSMPPNRTQPTNETKIIKLWLANVDGCADCNHTGYKGRIGIFEILENDGEIQKLISTNTPSHKIQTQAIRKGMQSLKTDGLVKALCGLTTVDEVLRVL